MESGASDGRRSFPRQTLGQQTLGRVQLSIDEGSIEDQLGSLIGDLRLPPVFDLALHWFEVPLYPVHSDRKNVNQIEALAVLGQDRGEVAAERGLCVHYLVQGARVKIVTESQRHSIDERIFPSTSQN